MSAKRSHAEQSVIMLARLYGQRDAARVMLGPRFAETMVKGAEMIRGVMAQHKCGEMDAALKLGKAASDDPVSVMIVLASVVEMLEPSLPASTDRDSGRAGDGQ